MSKKGVTSIVLSVIAAIIYLIVNGAFGSALVDCTIDAANGVTTVGIGIAATMIFYIVIGSIANIVTIIISIISLCINKGEVKATMIIAIVLIVLPIVTEVGFYIWAQNIHVSSNDTTESVSTMLSLMSFIV